MVNRMCVRRLPGWPEGGRRGAAIVEDRAAIDAHRNEWIETRFPGGKV
ncbi:MAG TPA: hypothetical protein VM621_07015 [Luteibacter sp.]|nr:hypothetical protein [Luteibacter sp.]